MRRVKVKKIKLPAGTTDKGLADMFNQVINGDGVTPTISYPRYRRLRGFCEGLVKVCQLLVGSPDAPGFAADSAARAEIEQFAAHSTDELAKFFGLDLSDHYDLNLLDDDLRARFAATYKSARESDVITKCVATCDALVVYRQQLADMTKLDHKFIMTMSGVEWSPIAFAPSMNIKDILVHPDISPSTVRLVMLFLHKLYVFGVSMYSELQSPDIDVDKFVDFISQNIDVLKKRDGLSRCDEAFEKIKESTRMLKTNFSSYYRQFVDTGDSTIIMQSFIVDVSKSTKMRPEVLRQFRTIIKYCTDVASSQSSDPQLKAACKKLSETMGGIDRKYNNMASLHQDSDGDADSDTESDEQTPENAAEMEARQAAMSKTVEQLAAEIGE